MRKNIRLPLLAALCFILFFTTIAMASEFRADVEQSREVTVRQGRIWVKDGTYRLEMEQPNGPDLYIIVGAKPGTTQVVLPSYKAYVEMPSDSFMSVMNDPFQSAEVTVKQYAVKKEGKETVQGFNCERQLIHHQESGILHRWIASELGFPIKIEQLLKEDYYVQLKNIEKRPIPKAQFQVPVGYTLKTEEQIQALIEADPAVAAKMAAYKKNRPRKSELRAMLSGGDTWNIVLTPGTKIRIKARPFGSSGAASWFAVPYKGQTALKTKAQCTYSGENNVKEDPASGVDGLSIGAIQGDFSVTVTLIGKPPQVQAIQNVNTKKKGQGSSWNAPRGYRRYHVRLYGLSDPAAGVRFTAAGKKHQLKISDGQYREFSYTDQDKLNDLDIMMDYGKVKVVCRAEYQSATTAHILLDEPFSSNRPGKAASAPASSGAGASTSKIGSATSAGTAAASSPKGGSASRMVLVLDASGSMWGQIKGKAKIEIAKEVISDLIDTIPADFQTGLIVYGHRRKGDCKDIEMMIPVGKHNAAAMNAKVAAISPKGKTPLSESVKRAAEALHYTKERATVILVSDGLETCDIDPCDLSAKLAMSGADFTVHVIGFDISKDDQDQLRCMADRTGGLFLTASDAGSLRNALFKTVEEVKAPPAPVVEDPGTAVLKAPTSVPVGSAFTVKWEGPNSRGDLIAVVKKGERNIRYVDYAYTKRGNPAKLTAPGVVGDYELRYVHGHSRKVIGRADLKATPVKASVKAPAAAQVAVDIEVTWQGPDYTGDYIAIAQPGTDGHHRIYYTYTRKGSPLKLQAPSDPGTYELRYILGKSKEILAQATIKIQAATASVQAPATADVASRFEVEWKGPDNQGDYIAIARPEKGPNHRIHYTYTKKGSPLQLLAPSDPGTYDVRYILSQGHKLLAKTTIEIKAVGASVQAPATAAAASLIDVTWQGPNNQGDYIAVVPPGQGADRRIKYTYTKKGSPLQLRTPSDPGTYDVIYLMSQGKKVLASTSIEIQPVTADINPPATAGVDSQIKIPWQGPGYDSDQITISRPDEAPGGRLTYRYTKRGNPAVIKTPKKPGTYEVRYILGQGKKVLAKKTITVK